MSYKAYVGTKIIQAEPCKNAEGANGYTVIYPDGYASWSPKDTFEGAYREISFHERQIVEMTDAEAQVSAISDGDPERCEHKRADYNAGLDEYTCNKCGEIVIYPIGGKPSCT